MANTLLLRLPAPDQLSAEWLIVDATGQPLGAVQSSPLADVAAAAAAASAKVVVIAPGTQILLAEPELPPGSGARLARAIPFALEEQLTEDIDTLFFAAGRRSAAGTTAVAVVAREVLQGWVDSLTGAGINPKALYADMSMMPDNPGQTVLWIDSTRLSVRRPGVLPFTMEIAPVGDALMMAGVIHEAGGEDTLLPPKEHALLYISREDWTRLQDEFEGLMPRFESLHVQLLAEGPLPWFARQLAAPEAVNLLQGEFARETDYSGQWRQWRTAALLAAGLLGAHVAVDAMQIRQANKRAAATEIEIQQAFAVAMPAEQLRDVRQQVQGRLDRIRRATAAPQTFLRAIQALGGAISGQPQTRIDALSFHEQTLDLKVSTGNVEALSLLSQSVAKQGFTAAIQSSTPNATGIDAQIQIRAPRPGSPR